MNIDDLFGCQQFKAKNYDKLGQNSRTDLNDTHQYTYLGGLSRKEQVVVRGGGHIRFFITVGTIDSVIP